ncbi:MAG TPA: bifunctional [glutamine synthetase] adenylyltransferase/[glutamine synthetase]-adenylyl-L-tyrosine phosphorylase [Xanthobacteraceae bacterium]|nr:bifunctional [glutamine synthetase] adenylyltransferase/[glutamine synthetase]-adenylyl-L-tyrosine phosphorylase [Xanthobacteraceae bacterium]
MARRSSPTGKSLAQRISRSPRTKSAAAAGKRIKAELFAEVKGKSAEVLNDIYASHPKARALTEGIAEGSPYLWELVKADPARWLALLQADPDTHLAEMIAAVSRASGKWANDEKAMRDLRLFKAEASLLTAVADIGGVWELASVTRALTQVADTAVEAAVKHLARNAFRDIAAKDRPENLETGYIVLALGKMGAFELNYSSDIDLMVFYEPEAAPKDAEPGQFFVRITRGLNKLLQERTGDGYVFRVDLRLRPDPASTQIAVSVPAALDYYERSGQNWERSALIKARPCAGDIAAGDAFLKNLSPFVWRKNLDYAALADVHAMKQQIHAYRGHGDIAIEGHNIKLGRGGIREIEFFVQTQQLIAGGRHPELRGWETVTMLRALADGGWIKENTRAELDAAYHFLRGVEHRLQMVADEQTHTLPAEREELEKFARFLGYRSRDEFAEELLVHLHNVQNHYAALFETRPVNIAAGRQLNMSGDGKLAENVVYFTEQGFKQPADAAGLIQTWFSGRYRPLKNEVVRESLAEIVPQFIDHVVRSENPDAALVALDRFLAALYGGVSLFVQLRQNGDFVALLATILSAAPRLAEILAQQPSVMDSLLEPAFFGALPDRDQLEKALNVSLEQAEAFEDFLDRARLFGREHMFLIGVRIISGTVSATQAGAVFAALADVLIRAMQQAVEKQFVKDHGKLRRQETAVLALGKLGGREMTAGSDLDLIVMYDFDAKHPESDGKKPLAGTQYFARLTQRLINSLTVRTNFGQLYHVDMRLRPSGNSGPLATALDAFEIYQRKEAWTWEHMALTRARIVTASPAFTARIEKMIRDVLCQPRDAAATAGDIAEMRRAVATERGDSDPWQIKDAAGGLLDVEFVAQYLQLVHAAEHPEILDTNTLRVLEAAAARGLLAPDDAELLSGAAKLYHDITQILRLCVSGPFEPAKAASGLLQLLARAADLPNFPTLDRHLIDTQKRVRACCERILGGSLSPEAD